jgi:hypothetical protein
MKKKRVPFFTICALLCAAVLFYLDKQKRNAQESGKTQEHAQAEIAGKSPTGHTALAPETSDSGPQSLGHELQFVANPETKKSEDPEQKSGTRHTDHGQASTQLSPAHANTTDSHTKAAPELNVQTQEQILRATASNATAQNSTARETKAKHTNTAHIAAPNSTATNTVSSQAVSRTIIVKNGITPAMLSYSHWTGTYSPTLFEIEVNDSPLEQGAQTSITLDQDNNFTVSYRYSFMNGYKTGARKVTFSVAPEKLDTQEQLIELGFSWKNKWHVISDQATHELIEDIK